MFPFLTGLSFPRGVHPPGLKESTRGKAIRRLAFAPRIILPLQQHFGRPGLPLVTTHQEVLRGQLIAAADGPQSVPLHAPVTGVVEGIELMPTARGPKAEAIIIRTAPGDTQAVRCSSPREDLLQASREEIIRLIQESGLVGQGGAAFPTHLKLQPPREYPVDTLVVNGCECEPYLTADHRIMLEQADAVLTGVRLAMRAVGAQRALIGVEDDKPDAIEALRAGIADTDRITVCKVRSKYPQGSEKMLIKALLDREVPSGGFPFNVGVVVNNVGTMAQMGSLLPRGEGLIERVITVAGPGIARPGNYLVPLGTPLRFLLQQLGYTGQDASRLIVGGPMMGNTVSSLDVPVTKGMSGLVVLPETEADSKAERIHACIRCGYCVEACPVGLNPSDLGKLAARREYALMQERFHLNDCIECGCCAYMCPSHIPLVQYFRIAKALNRERLA